MRKIDIERSRDYYKGCLKSSLNLLIIMTKKFEEIETKYRERINKLEQKGKEK